MTLRDALAAIGSANYDYTDGLNQPAFALLDELAAEIRPLVPSHYLVPVSRGAGNRPIGLWASVLDPQVTTSSQRGTYVVYLYNAACNEVSLSLNQGVTNAESEARKTRVDTRILLRNQALRMRQHLGDQVDDLELEIDLRGQINSKLLRLYEAGNAAAVTWQLRDLPDEAVLQERLQHFLDLYAQVVPALMSDYAAGGVGAFWPKEAPREAPEKERRFEPRDDSDYLSNIAAQENKRKSRSHQTLVNSLARWSQARDFEPNTNVHPRDLVLHRGNVNLLVEVKIFPFGRPRLGVRECIGQLFEYAKFYGHGRDELVAALSAHPGDAYVDLLDSLGIATLWPSRGTWAGSKLAATAGLVDV